MNSVSNPRFTHFTPSPSGVRSADCKPTHKRNGARLYVGHPRWQLHVSEQEELHTVQWLGQAAEWLQHDTNSAVSQQGRGTA